MSGAAALVAGLALAACGGAPGASDAGAPADAGIPNPATLEVGTGILEFAPFGDGPTEIVEGVQGGGRFEGHHIWTALRLGKATPDALDTYGVTIMDADANLAATFVFDAARAPFEADDEGRFVLAGLAPRLRDCCAVEGRAFTVIGEVTFLDGERLTAQTAGLAGMCSVACD